MTEVAIVCDECERRASVDVSRLGASLRRHNERQHGGDAVAYVAPEHVDRLEAAPEPET